MLNKIIREAHENARKQFSDQKKGEDVKKKAKKKLPIKLLGQQLKKI